MKITLMEDATLYIDKNNQAKLELGNNLVLFESDSELEDLKTDSKDFFELKEVTRENTKCVLTYQIDEGYQSFFEAKRYSKVIRLSLLEKVLELNPLNNFNEKVLLHPRNIYFKDLKTVKFLYRSNRFLPNVKFLSEIDQYKLLILSMLSKYSYEQLKIKKRQLLEKENNSFLNIIESAETIPQLNELIKERLFLDETLFFKNLEEDQKKSNVKKLQSIVIAGGLICTLLVITIISSRVQIKDYRMVAEQQITKANTSSQAYELLASGKTDQGIAKLKETNPSGAKLAEAYFISKQYDNAINIESDYANKVVSKLYESKEENKILGLKTQNKYIDVEKHILSYDRNSLLVDKEFVQDKEQLARAGQAFLKNHDIATAKEINLKLNNEPLKQAIQDAENSLAAITLAAKATPS
ncbi:type VII secretion protein EssB/YukC [Flavobacterium sp. UBA6046]|uniref:type VII secretion protein EssB/YukC n=1 Tax=Flavobacterium sp. UBA6046 TaxID=1946552 RepID=UPI0025C35426|nr:type VII secretion protein EssB/YukC [Flavobacterium sp. UBA6046]